MNAIVQRSERAEVAQVESDSGALMALISRAAMTPDYNMERLERLFELKKQWDAQHAEKAFNTAMADFKRNPPEVIHDMDNSQYGSRYSSLANFVGTVNKALGEFGLEASWEIEQADKIKVTCVLAHALGHKRRVTMMGPPDTSGAKNPIQQIKSTITYLELSTFQAITGIVARGANEDDDGNSAGVSVEYITEKQAADVAALITEVKADKAGFLKYFGAASIAEIKASDFRRVLAAIEAKRKKS